MLGCDKRVRNFDAAKTECELQELLAKYPFVINNQPSTMFR